MTGVTHEQAVQPLRLPHDRQGGKPALYRLQLRPLMRAQEHCHKQAWGREIHNIAVEWFDTPKEAIEAETLAIQTEKPLWNVHRNVDNRKWTISTHRAAS